MIGPPYFIHYIVLYLLGHLDQLLDHSTQIHNQHKEHAGSDQVTLLWGEDFSVVSNVKQLHMIDCMVAKSTTQQWLEREFTKVI